MGLNELAELGEETKPETTAPALRTDFRTLLVLAWPLIISNSFTTVQIFIDRLFLSLVRRRCRDGRGGGDHGLLASLHSPLHDGRLLQPSPQYTGAGRPLRVGPAVWQGLYFSVIGGVGFLCLLPASGSDVRVMGHSPKIQTLEASFFRCLCWLALPGLITATTSAFLRSRAQFLGDADQRRRPRRYRDPRLLLDLRQLRLPALGLVGRRLGHGCGRVRVGTRRDGSAISRTLSPRKRHAEWQRSSRRYSGDCSGTACPAVRNGLSTSPRQRFPSFSRAGSAIANSGHGTGHRNQRCLRADARIGQAVAIWSASTWAKIVPISRSE